MARVGGALHVPQVAGHAVGADIYELVINVAGRAPNANMRAGKRKLREIVVKIRGVPAGGVMALGTVLREAGRYVIGVVRSVEILLVATEAIHRRARKPAARMAAHTSQCGVCAREREPRQRMIELGYLPLDDVMAGFAIRRKACGPVIDDGRLIIPLVAADALRAKPHIDAGRGPGVAGIASRGGMCPEQGEPIPVVLERLRVLPPTLHRVAILAIRAELAFMKVCMTTDALHPRFGKNFRDMARITRNIHVHAAQRIAGIRVMVELGLRSQWSPCGGGVAVLTGNCELAVRIAWSRLCVSCRRHPQHDRETAEQFNSFGEPSFRQRPIP